MWSQAGIDAANSYGLSTLTLAKKDSDKQNIHRVTDKQKTTTSFTRQFNTSCGNKSVIPQRVADNKKNASSSSHSSANHFDGMRTGFGVTGMEVGGTGMEVGGTGMEVGGTGMEVGGTGMEVGGTGMEVGGTGMEVGGTGMSLSTLKQALDKFERPIIHPIDGRGGKKRKSKRMKSRYLKKYKRKRTNKTRKYRK